MKNTPQLALITGANSGLGAACAQLLAKNGYTVVLLDLHITHAKILAEQLKGFAIAADVSDAMQVESAISQIKKYGELRVCVNCAGVVAAERIVGLNAPMPLEHFEAMIKINLIGTFNVMRLASFAMRTLSFINSDNERGIIINTASIAAFEGQFGQVAYSASKGGVVSMTLPAARELSDLGIRVVAIAPGLFHTPMMENIPKAAQEQLQESTLFPKRLGQAEEFAQCVLNMIQNSMYNGCVIRLDGGVRLNRGK